MFAIMKKIMSLDLLMYKRLSFSLKKRKGKKIMIFIKAWDLFCLEISTIYDMFEPLIKGLGGGLKISQSIYTN